MGQVKIFEEYRDEGALGYPVVVSHAILVRRGPYGSLRCDIFFSLILSFQRPPHVYLPNDGGFSQTAFALIRHGALEVVRQN